MFGNPKKYDFGSQGSKDTDEPSATDAGEHLSNRLEKRRDNTIALLECYTSRQQARFDSIEKLVELRDKQADTITSILSDYTEIVNQVSVVATLTLGAAVGLYSVLIGSESYFHPEWKQMLLCISSIFTVAFSVTSVVESFFLGVRVDQIEARFLAGVYPHIDPVTDNTRSFDPTVLKDINSVFNIILVTFFTSFLSFAFSILAVAYIGMGRSNSIWSLDERTVTTDFNGNIFQMSVAGQSVSDLEPGYLMAVWVSNIIILVTYVIIFWRFFQSHAEQINARSLMRFSILCCCAKPEEYVETTMYTPIEYAADKFNNLQKDITANAQKWQQDYIIWFDVVERIGSTEGRRMTQKEGGFFDAISKKIKDRVTRERATSRGLSPTTEHMRATWEEQMILISEVEKAYDSIAYGSIHFELISQAVQTACAQLESNSQIIISFLDSEKPLRTTWSGAPKERYPVGGKFLNAALTIWAFTGGIIISIILFGLSIPTWLVRRMLYSCNYVTENRTLCEFSAVVSLWHFMWMESVQNWLVVIPEEKESRRDSQVGRQRRNAWYGLGEYRNPNAGKRGRRKRGRGGSSKFYESVSLKL